ncbi:HelD family protein [Allonocardiopsis opalescens]|uniref:DNA helicase IV n=1 Tax=Allonocardiopsis opalescens TaxID=1144618 RepID=A0A2T0Q9L1_9ACTN|nr:AAA family ATPase [Allonocardiopsis opalescens]PRY00586.1 DNA helicase IV [Allonocardiopsis opalescens]
MSVPAADPARPDAPEPGPPAPEILAERAHAADAREALRTMRQKVLDTATSQGDVVGDKYSNAVLREERRRRAEQLVDLPDVPPFFGRLDYAPGTVFEADPGDDGFTAARTPDGDRVYVGRRHVQDPAGTPLVIDWRAPVSVAFYRATRAEPMRVRNRRRFGFSGALLTAVEDEPLQGADTGSGGGGELLAAEIERPRVGPMRDIVATIQPEQDDLVRTALEESVCVQGAPGTGKTAVGLHRVAYLLYAHRDRLRRTGVLIIGPNTSFLSYIKGVLPALGEVAVGQTTVTELLTTPATGAPRGADTPEAARIKGDARMAEVIRRALWARPRAPEETLVVQRGARRLRIYPGELADILDELRAREVPYGAGRELLAHRIAHTVLSRLEAAGEVCDDRTHDQVRRDRAVRAAVNAMWPAADPAKVVLTLLSDPAALAAAAEGLLDPGEQRAVLWARPARGPKSARWSEADLALVDEAAQLVERRPSLGHIVVDEAQDLSPMQCRAIGRRCASGSVTVLGDIAQGTTPWAADDWPTLLAHLGKPEARLTVLDRGYRVPQQIISYASRLLPGIAPGLAPPVAVRRAPGSLTVERAAPGALADAVAAACQEALADEGSVGLIAADADTAALAERLAAEGLPALSQAERPDALGASRLVVVDATLAKGLEFDTVVVAEPSRIAAAEPRGARRLYVVLTRAVSRLRVLHSEPLPAELAAV